MTRMLIALVVAVGVLAAVAVGPAHAQTSGASYFCSKHPGAVQCHKPPKTIPSTGGGGTYPRAGGGSVVAGLSTSPAQPARPAQLPATGGGAGAPRGNSWLWLAVLLALVSGLGLRLAVPRTDRAP